MRRHGSTGIHEQHQFDLFLFRALPDKFQLSGIAACGIDGFFQLKFIFGSLAHDLAKIAERYLNGASIEKQIVPVVFISALLGDLNGTSHPVRLTQSHYGGIEEAGSLGGARARQWHAATLMSAEILTEMSRKLAATGSSAAFPASVFLVGEIKRRTFQEFGFTPLPLFG